jgi:hypothetical protein
MKKKKLNSVAPILSELKHKENCFKVPNNYFNNFEEQILSETKLLNFNIKNNNFFKIPNNYFDGVETIVISKLKAEIIQENKEKAVPKNYFDSVEDAVLTKINASKKLTISKSILLKFISPVAIAASLLLIFNIFYQSKKITFETISTSEIDHWVENNLMEAESYQIANIYDEVTLELTNFGESITDEDVLNYLHQEDIDNLLLDN